MARKKNTNKEVNDFSTDFRDIKECKEIFGKSETTMRNLVRRWRKGEYPGNIKIVDGRVFFRLSWLSELFEVKMLASDTPPPTALSEVHTSVIALLEKQLDEQNKQIERLQLLLHQKEENLRMLTAPPKRRRWFNFFGS
jgi:hypothetical protein